MIMQATLFILIIIIWISKKSNILWSLCISVVHYADYTLCLLIDFMNYKMFYPLTFGNLWRSSNYILFFYNAINWVYFLNYYLFNTNIACFVISGSWNIDQSLKSKENIEQRDIFDLFPRASTFRKDKLPTLKEAIGIVRGYHKSHNCTFQNAIVVVAHKLYDYWVIRNYKK